MLQGWAVCAGPPTGLLSLHPIAEKAVAGFAQGGEGGIRDFKVLCIAEDNSISGDSPNQFKRQTGLVGSRNQLVICTGSRE